MAQLKSADYANIADLNFDYDANGNRNSNGNTPGVDNRQEADSAWTFGYDPNGNLTSRTNKTTSAVIEYEYDTRNRLTAVRYKTSATGSLTKVVKYGYDAIDRRISETVDTDGNGSVDQTDYFVNQGMRANRDNAGDSVVLKINTAGQVVSRILHGALVDEVLAEENVTSITNREVLWTLPDHQGSVRDLAKVDSSGNATVVNHIMYDAFGNTTSETDAAISHMFGYTGREFDKETGLQYNRARYYDPSLGRWMSKDPIGFDAGDTNLYRMTGNHPNMATDPSGNRGWEIGGLTPGQWTYATGVLFYEWGANGYRGVKGIVSGEAGTHMGNRAVEIKANRTGEEFDGDFSDWFSFSYIIAQEFTGSNSIAESGVGIDVAEERVLDPWERAQRGSSGIGALAGSAAGGLSVASKFGVGVGGVRIPYTPNLPTITIPLPKIVKDIANTPIRWPIGKQLSTVELSIGSDVLDPMGIRQVLEDLSETAPSGGATLGSSSSTNYRATFHEANPGLQGQVVVHHAVEQQTLTRFPGTVTEAQIHSLENLRGIPKPINSDVHLSKIRKSWNEFYRNNPSPTPQQFLDHATVIDNEFGHLFNPPIR